MLTPSELDILRARWDAIPEPDPATRNSARERVAARFARAPRRLSTVEGRRFPPRLLKPRVIVIAALLPVAAVTTAASFGVHVPVIDFWSADRVDHNSRIYHDFATLDVGAPPGMATGVIPGETRKVGTIEGEALWVAPTSEGGFCTLLGGGGGCDRTGTVPLDITLSAAVVPPGKSPGRTPPNEIATAISGYVNGRWADALELRFEDGTTVRPRLIWVSNPIDVGFFYFRTTPAQREPGHALSSAVALNDQGIAISTQRIDHSAQEVPPADAILTEARDAARIETRDGPAVLRRAPTRYEGRCIWLDFAGVQHDVAPCLPKNYARDGFEWRFVRTTDDVLLVGAVPPSYTAVRLRYADGDTTEITPVADGLDGWLLYEIPRQHLRREAEVTGVSAVTADGKEVANEPLSADLLLQPCYAPLPLADPDRCG